MRLCLLAIFVVTGVLMVSACTPTSRSANAGQDMPTAEEVIIASEVEFPDPPPFSEPAHAEGD